MEEEKEVTVVEEGMLLVNNRYLSLGLVCLEVFLFIFFLHGGYL